MSQKHELFTKQSQKWELTNYGEFISYYHAHVQILDNLLKTKEQNSNEINRKKKNLRKFMKDNIRNINHFIENADKLAQFVSMSLEDFNQYMMENFLQTLEEIQKTMKKQFVEKVYLEEQEKFFNESIGAGILKNTVFSFEEREFKNQDKLFLIKELKTGKEIDSLSLTKEKKAQLENQALTSDSEKIESKEKEPEIQILDEIVNQFGNLLKGEKLVLESKIINEEHTEEQIQNNDNLIGDFDDLEFEHSSETSSEEPENQDFIEEHENIQSQIQNVLKEEEHENVQSQIQNVLKEEEHENVQSQIQNVLKEEEHENIQSQIQNVLKEEEHENIQSQIQNVLKEEEHEDIISFFEYTRLLNLNKKNKKTDIKNYKKWLISLDETKRGIIFIQDLLEKDSKQPIEWNSSLKKVSQNIKVDYNQLKKIKDSISFLFAFKKELEMLWKICQKNYPSVIPTFQTIWNSLLTICSSNIKNKKIIFDTLKQEILNLLQADNQKTLRKIFQQWIEKKLKKKFED